MEWAILGAVVLVGGSAYMIWRRRRPAKRAPVSRPVEPAPDIPTRPAGPSAPTRPETVRGEPQPAAACTPALVVNGVAAVVGAAYVEVPFGGLPSQLVIEATDCPHPTAEVRENFARTGAGTGELVVGVRKLGAIPAAFGRYGSARVQLGPKTPTVLEGNVRVDESSAQLIEWITKPVSSAPDGIGVADIPVRLKASIPVRSTAEKDGDRYPVAIKVDFHPADGSRALAIVFREPRE